GRRVIGSHRSAAEDGPVLARFQRYVSKAAGAGSPELEFLWGMMLEARNADGGDLRPNPRFAEAMQYLDGDDARFLLLKLIQFSVPKSYVNVKTFESDVLARCAQTVRKAYAPSLRRMVESLGVDAFARGVADYIRQMSADRSLSKETQEEIAAV